MAAAMKKLVVVLTVAFVVSTVAPVAGAETHHVVGGDRGWDVDSDIGSWSAGRTFRVGDKICKIHLLVIAFFFHFFLRNFCLDSGKMEIGNKGKATNGIIASLYFE